MAYVYRELIQKGLAEAARVGWAQSCDGTLDVIQDALSITVPGHR